ncbi:glycosyltransferase family 2 protein [Brachyspira alvinipulli]|uniref:glycosyltransferase family 2 protein n=1 Tax=Brachyspira alvinipulli TaxID=84379 RepID=UPI00047F7018|nr:glycosyltransferase family 2 protein [Brachyspira alvinipulli]
MFKFLFSKRDEGINCNRKIFGISITTKPNRLKLKQLDEKIEKLKKENTILNNLVSSCSYQNLTKEYIANLDSRKPFVSVIITVYNLGRRYLVQCLETVINQSLKNIEIILVNDCSPLEEDDKVCNEYADKDKRIKYIKNDINLGAGKSRMVGLSIAKGYAISFIDGDDFLSLNLYEISFYEMIKNNVDIVCYSYNMFNVDDMTFRDSNIGYTPYTAIYGKYVLEFYSSKNNPLDMGLWTKLYKKELLEKLDSDSIINRNRADDITYNFKIFLHAKSLLYIPLNLYFYTYNRNTSITNSSIKNDKYFTDIKDVFLDINNYLVKNHFESYVLYLNALFSHFFIDLYEVALYMNRLNKTYHYLELLSDIINEFIHNKIIDRNILLQHVKSLTDKNGIIEWYNKNIKG